MGLGIIEVLSVAEEFGFKVGDEFKVGGDFKVADDFKRADGFNLSILSRVWSYV